jgi:hypothetical protein
MSCCSNVKQRSYAEKGVLGRRARELVGRESLVVVVAVEE